MVFDRAISVFAGLMVLGSLLLSQLHSPYWLLLTGFVGFNMVQASFTGLCPAAFVFDRLGITLGKPGCSRKST